MIFPLGDQKNFKLTVCKLHIDDEIHTIYNTAIILFGIEYYFSEWGIRLVVSQPNDSPVCSVYSRVKIIFYLSRVLSVADYLQKSRSFIETSIISYYEDIQYTYIYVPSISCKLHVQILFFCNTWLVMQRGRTSVHRDENCFLKLVTQFSFYEVFWHFFTTFDFKALIFIILAF